MAYTTLDYDRLRRDTNTDTTTLPDSECVKVFAEAAELQTLATAIKAQARIIVLGALLAEDADSVSYTQNNSQESASDRFKQRKSLLDYWESKLLEAIEAGAGVGATIISQTTYARLQAVW